MDEQDELTSAAQLLRDSVNTAFGSVNHARAWDDLSDDLVGKGRYLDMARYLFDQGYRLTKATDPQATAYPTPEAVERLLVDFQNAVMNIRIPYIADGGGLMSAHDKIVLANRRRGELFDLYVRLLHDLEAKGSSDGR
jgi:hypothetical protein